jgi:hypothetical protein
LFWGKILNFLTWAPVKCIEAPVRETKSTSNRKNCIKKSTSKPVYPKHVSACVPNKTVLYSGPFLVHLEVPVKTFCMYFGLLLMILWVLGTNTLLPLYWEKYLTLVSPNLIYFGLHLMKYDMFLKINVQNWGLPIITKLDMLYEYVTFSTWFGVCVLCPTVENFM